MVHLQKKLTGNILFQIINILLSVLGAVLCSKGVGEVDPFRVGPGSALGSSCALEHRWFDVIVQCSTIIGCFEMFLAVKWLAIKWPPQGELC